MFSSIVARVHWREYRRPSGAVQWMASQESDPSWNRDCKVAKRKMIIKAEGGGGAGREVRKPRKSERTKERGGPRPKWR